jgi:hypothetical protein
MNASPISRVFWTLVLVPFLAAAAAEAAPVKPKAPQAAALAKSKSKKPAAAARNPAKPATASRLPAKSASSRLAQAAPANRPTAAKAPARGGAAATQMRAQAKAGGKKGKGSTKGRWPTNKQNSDNDGGQDKEESNESSDPQSRLAATALEQRNFAVEWWRRSHESKNARRTDLGRGVQRTELPGGTKISKFPDGTYVVRNPHSGTVEVLRANNEWLRIDPKSGTKVHATPNKTFSFYDKDGRKTFTTLPGGKLPPREIPIEPLDVGPRKIIDTDHFNRFLDETVVDPNRPYRRPFDPGLPSRGERDKSGKKKPTDTKLPGKNPFGGLFGNEEHRQLLDGREGSLGGSKDSDEKESSNSGSSGSSQDNDSGFADHSFPDTFAGDDEPFNNLGDGSGVGQSDDASDRSSTSGGEDDGADNDDGPDAGGDDEDNGGAEQGGSASGQGGSGGQPPPEGLDFSDIDFESEYDPDEGWAPMPGGFGDDEDDGSQSDTDAGGSNNGASGDDAGGGDDSGEDDSSGGSGDDSDEPNGSEAGSGEESDNPGSDSESSVGYTPSDPDQPVIVRDAATTAALRRGLKETMRRRLGTQTTPTDQDTEENGAGTVLLGQGGQDKQIVTLRDHLIIPAEDAPRLGPVGDPPRGPSQNEILPAPDAPDQPQNGSSGPPIQNEADQAVGDGSATSGSTGQELSRPGSSGSTSSSSGSSTTSKLDLIRSKLKPKTPAHMPKSVRRWWMQPSG